MAQKVQLVPNPHNRIDIGKYFATNNIELFDHRGPQSFGVIFPMFLKDQGSLLTTTEGNKKLKIYPNFAHLLKYGCQFSKNPTISRVTVRKTIESLKNFFTSGDFQNLNLATRFEVTETGHSSIRGALVAAEKSLDGARNHFRDFFSVTELSLRSIKFEFLKTCELFQLVIAKRNAAKLSEVQKRAFLAFLNAAGWSTDEWLRIWRVHRGKKFFESGQVIRNNRPRRITRRSNGRFAARN